jgi:hypothetical protein
LRVWCGAHRRRERVGERVGGQRLAAHGRRLEQRQTPDVVVEPIRVCVHDRLAADAEADAGPALGACRISYELLHYGSVAAPREKGLPGRVGRGGRKLHPADRLTPE